MPSAVASRAVLWTALLVLASPSFAEDSSPPPAASAQGADLTFEFRVRGTGSPARVECGEGSGWRDGEVAFERDFGVSFHAGGVAFGVKTDDGKVWTLCGETDVLDGAWHHVAVQRRGVDGQLWIWIDGKLDAGGYGPLGELVDVAEPTERLDDPFDGHLDASRRTAAVRYLAPFAPPGDGVDRDRLAGMPAGGVLEAYSNGELGQTILFARVPEPLSGPVRVTIRDGAGRARAEVAGALEEGSALMVWDGTGTDGQACEPGSYEATLEAEIGTLTARFRVSGI